MDILNDYKAVISESIHSDAVKKIITYLNAYYKPVDGVFPVADEFISQQMIEKNINGEKITPKELIMYVKSKFPYSIEFIFEIVKEWYTGEIRPDFILHKNVTMYD